MPGFLSAVAAQPQHVADVGFASSDPIGGASTHLLAQFLSNLVERHPHHGETRYLLSLALQDASLRALRALRPCAFAVQGPPPRRPVGTKPAAVRASPTLFRITHGITILKVEKLYL